MPSPFKQMKTKVPQRERYDEWGGAFSCMTHGCYGVANIAAYFPSEKILTWKCPNEHISVLEDVDD